MWRFLADETTPYVEASEVKYLAVIKDGREARRPLDSHFGAWIVCTEQLGPFEIVAFDENGAVLARISDDGHPPTRPNPPPA